MKCPLLAAIVLSLLVAAPASVAAGNGIIANPAVPTTASGVSFTVTTGGGNRDFATVAVNCSKPLGTVIYATVLNVIVTPKGTGTSQTIYPPASSCVADLEKIMQIGKPRVLASVSFEVTQAP